MHRHKYILHILLGLSLTILWDTSLADCPSGGIRVFPQSNVISTNPIFIVEGHFMAQPVIRDFKLCSIVYLTSGEDTVLLTVLKTLESQYGLTQAVLKPLSNLVPGRHYKLKIDDLDDFNKSRLKYDHEGWTVSANADTQIPSWNKEPTYNSKWIIRYGCGPEVLVNFCICISDNSPVVVYTRVKNILTNSSSDYYITPDATFLSVGHGMCSGEFAFENGQVYEATFSLMDASGNISAETPPINFISPTANDIIKERDPKVNCHCPSQILKETRGWSSLLLLFIFGLVVFITTSVLGKFKGGEGLFNRQTR